MSVANISESFEKSVSAKLYAMERHIDSIMHMMKYRVKFNLGALVEEQGKTMVAIKLLKEYVETLSTKIPLEEKKRTENGIYFHDIKARMSLWMGQNKKISSLHWTLEEINTLISKVEYLVTHASKTQESLHGAYLVSCMMEISTHLQVIVDYALEVDRALTVLELGQIPKLLLPPKELKEVLETIEYMLLAEGHFELPNSIDPIDPFYWYSQLDTSSFFLSTGHLQIVVQIPLVQRKRNYVLYQTFPTSTEGPVGTNHDGNF